MSTRLTVLGCGHSGGSPLIGDEWLACDPTEPKNRRTRSSVLIEHEDHALLVDTGPDIKNQVSSHKINRIDAVLYTHYHADHTNGMEDVRVWARRRQMMMPVYATPETFADLRPRFEYLLYQHDDPLYPLHFHPYELGADHLYTPIRLGGVPVTLFEQDHGTCTSLGLRIGNVAYSTDMRQLGARSIEVLKGIDIWLVDGGAYHSETNPVHASLKTVYALNEIIGAKQVYITHMPPTMDYQSLIRELPDGYAPAYDGLILDVQGA